jgi:hypothetical protein
MDVCDARGNGQGARRTATPQDRDMNSTTMPQRQDNVAGVVLAWCW